MYWSWLPPVALLCLACADHPAQRPARAPAAPQPAAVMMPGPSSGPAVALAPAHTEVGKPPPAPGWLGVSLSARQPHEPGVVVSGVMRRSPAAVSGLQVGDVVLGINEERVHSPEQLSLAIARLGARGRASLALQRDEEHRLLAVELGENPGPEGQLRLGFLDAPAPEFAGVLVAQGDVGPTLQALRGRVVVLEFWATWCGACRALMPTLNDWHARLAAHGGLVLSITTDPLEIATQAASELGLRYPVLSDPDGVTATTYQAFAVPTLFVIDRAGVVRDVAVGYDVPRLEALEETLSRLAAEI